MAGHAQSVIPLAGKNWTAGNGEMMRKRFQVGHAFKRGKRVKLWVGCYREWALAGGQLKRIQRRQVIGPCAEKTKNQAAPGIVAKLQTQLQESAPK